MRRFLVALLVAFPVLAAAAPPGPPTVKVTDGSTTVNATQITMLGATVSGSGATATVTVAGFTGAYNDAPLGGSGTSASHLTCTACFTTAGGTLTGGLGFTDNTLDIGNVATLRPRTLYLGTSAVAPLYTTPSMTGVQFQTASTTGLGNSGGLPTMYISSSAKWVWQAAEFSPNADAGGSLGDTTTRFASAWVQAYGTKSQAISSGSTSLTIDISLGSVAVVTLTASISVAWTVSNCIIGQPFMIPWVQGGAGSMTIANANAIIKFLPTTYLGVDHGAPTLSTVAGKRDTEFFMCEDSTHVLEVRRNFAN